MYTLMNWNVLPLRAIEKLFAYAFQSFATTSLQVSGNKSSPQIVHNRNIFFKKFKQKILEKLLLNIGCIVKKIITIRITRTNRFKLKTQIPVVVNKTFFASLLQLRYLCESFCLRKLNNCEEMPKYLCGLQAFNVNTRRSSIMVRSANFRVQTFDPRGRFNKRNTQRASKFTIL